jgi:hypothetical protein
MNKRNRIMTTTTEIVDYWSQRETECGLSADWADAHKRCWRCARKVPLQKCHIIPDALDGKDAPENLILLCLRCHREAPDIADTAFIWTWLRKHAVSLYDTDWILRGYFEFERLFGRKSFTILNEEIPKSKLVSALRKYRQKTTIHFGEGRPSPSTVAWMFSQIEKDLIGRGSILR